MEAYRALLICFLKDFVEAPNINNICNVQSTDLLPLICTVNPWLSKSLCTFKSVQITEIIWITEYL